MFIDYPISERRNILSQSESESYLLPGYTGHCPTLKFRVGKRYGANTKEIIQDFSKCGVLNRNLKLLETNCQPLSRGNHLVQSFPKIELNPRSKDKDYSNKENHLQNCGKYILGYTGYIPGMCFQYGRSFGSIAEDCHKNIIRTRKFGNPVGNDLKNYISSGSRKNKSNNFETKKDRSKISSDHIPITGYTGHIPMLKISGASICQPYHNAAKIGLSLLKQGDE